MLPLRAVASAAVIAALLTPGAPQAASPAPGPITERRGFALDLACPFSGPDYCEDPYADLLLHPALQEAARPVPRCRRWIGEMIEAGLMDRMPERWPEALQSPPDMNAAVLDAMGLHHLFDPALLPARPLEIVVLGDKQRSSPSGATYQERTLVLRDPIVGDVPALLLLPAGGAPVPGVVALPGHGETPAWYRDHRLARFFPENGFAVLIIGFREWFDAKAESDTSARLLCQGFPLIGVRAYEGLLGLRALQFLAPTRGEPLAVLGHSGGSAAANLLAWLDVNPAAAQITDMQPDYWNIDDPGVIDCETSPGLYALHLAINDFASAPRPILEVPYGYAPDWENEQEPDPDDPGAIELFLPFLREHLLGTGRPVAGDRRVLPLGDGLRLPLRTLPAEAGAAAGLLVGETEVTMEQFQRFAPEYRVTLAPAHEGRLDPDDAHQPALVSWDDAMAFCAWASEQTGVEVRLPSEAEWEAAAGAGSGQTYFWGDDPRWAFRWMNGAGPETRSDFAPWPDGPGFPYNDGFPGLAPVGSYAPNRYGLYDLLGNAAEWCADAFDAERRVLRGGAWDADPQDARLDHREGMHPRQHGDRAGFRVVVRRPQ